VDQGTGAPPEEKTLKTSRTNV